MTAPRLFRKAILKPCRIVKNGHDITVDRAYMKTLIRNFTAGTMDHVPFQLADHLNAHSYDPSRTRGRLVKLEMTADDRLVGIFETTTAGTKLLSDTPYLGCSVSIDPEFCRADGRKTGPTLVHVAGCLDPEVGGLGDWLALSHDHANAYSPLLWSRVQPHTKEITMSHPRRFGPAGGPIEPLPEKTPAELLAEYKAAEAKRRAEIEREEEAERSRYSNSVDYKAPEYQDFINRVKAQNPHRHMQSVAVTGEDGKKTVERQLDPEVAKAAEQVRQAEMAYFQRYGHWPKEEDPKPENIWTAETLDFVERYNAQRGSNAEHNRFLLERAQRDARWALDMDPGA